MEASGRLSFASLLRLAQGAGIHGDLALFLCWDDPGRRRRCGAGQAGGVLGVSIGINRAAKPGKPLFTKMTSQKHVAFNVGLVMRTELIKLHYGV